MAQAEVSLFTRLIALVALVLAVGAAVLVSAAWRYGREAADVAYDRLLMGAALQMAEAVTVENGFIRAEPPVSAFELLALSSRDRIFYRIVDPAGRTITGYEDLSVSPDQGRASDAPSARDSRFRGAAVRVVETTRALADETARGDVTVVVAQTTEARVALAKELTLRAAALILTMSALALAGVAVAIRFALRPVDRIGAALRDRDPRDLTPVDLAAPRELSPFLAATNAFIGRLQTRMEMMERFVADAAHQIRTPLAALTAQIDLAARRPDEADRLDRARARAEELSRLVGQLLSDATVSHRAGSVSLTPVDVGDLLRRAMREAIPETLERDLLATFEGPAEAVTIAADPISLKEAAKNLIDNALRHGAPGRLTIRLRQTEAGAEIEVEDDGPGIPPERRELALRRFAAPSPGGSGLGLSIAARAAAAHGGGLDFRGADEKGFAVILRVSRGSVT